MAKSTKTYEERIRALEKKEQESIEATKKLIAQRKELEKLSLIHISTIQDLNVLMQWRMEVLHEVFSIPSERSVTELESENRRYYQTELPPS